MIPAVKLKKRAGPAKDNVCKAIQLSTLGKVSYVSQSGIDSLMESAKRDGIPETTSRGSNYRARNAVVHQRTPYGALVEPLSVQRKNGGDDIDIGVQNPIRDALVRGQAFH